MLDRSHQVACMADVYRCASRVHIQLGQPFEGSTDVIQSIEETVREFDIGVSLADQELRKQGVEEKLQRCLEHLDVDLLQRFFSSPWFMRLWVVQESVLSKQASFFYGSTGVDMDTVLTLAVFLRENGYRNYLSRGRKVEHIPEMEYATELYEKRLARSQVKREHGLNDDQIGTTFVNLLSSFHDRQNLEPRDKIYAILGLCWPCTASEITPDYSRSLRDIYLHATSLAFTESASDVLINALRYARNMGHKDTSWYKENDWPTWLPCWQHPFDLMKNLSFIHSTSCLAANNLRLGEQELLSINGNQLSFSGAIIDTVTKTTSPMTRKKKPVEAKLDVDEAPEVGGQEESVVVRVEDVEHAVVMCLDIILRTKPQQGQKSTLSMIGETLVAGACEYDEDISLGEAHFASVLEFTSHKSMSRDDLSSAPNASSGDPWKYLTNFDVHSTRRVCFVTSEGYFGLGSEYMMVGDVICVPQGGLTPYVLRPEEAHYILIGQCYMSVSSGQEYLQNVADMFLRTSTLVEARRISRSVGFVYTELLVSEPTVDNVLK